MRGERIITVYKRLYFNASYQKISNIVVETEFSQSMQTNLTVIDIKAIRRLVSSKPYWQSNCLASEALNIDTNVILHAGPPFESPSQVPVPILNSACAALLFEGSAANRNEAIELLHNGSVKLKPAQDFATVVPLAGVVSASMWLHKIVDHQHPENVAFAPINGGNGPAMRLGMYSNKVVEHLRWINSHLAEFLKHCLHEPIELISIARHSLKNADDCHGRTIAASQNIVDKFELLLATHGSIKEFFANGPSFFLNLWMAACKCMLGTCNGTANCSVVTAAGGNGKDVGIKVAGMKDHWFTTPANPPEGDLGPYPRSRALGAIGDSAIVDAAGFGAMAVSYSKPQMEIFRNYLPRNFSLLPQTLLLQVHDQFQELQLLTGLTAEAVVQTQTTPIASLGIIDRDGIDGRLGGGIYRYPMDCFTQAVKHLKDKD